MRDLGCEYAIMYFPEAAYDRSGIELFEREGHPRAQLARVLLRCSRVDGGLPSVQNVVQYVSVPHSDHRPRAISRR